jgi:hypothetical protein
MALESVVTAKFQLKLFGAVVRVLRVVCKVVGSNLDMKKDH